MDLSQFITWQMLFSFVLLSLGIYAMTLVIRTIVEVLWVNAKNNRYWREIFLPLGGIANGIILGALLSVFPLPELLSNHLSNRMIYGAVCGLFASFLYNRAKSWINSRSVG